MKNNKIPRLVTNGAELLEHEMATVLFLQHTLKEDIELLPPSHTPQVRMPDFIMQGMMWEMKAPIVGARKTIERSFYCATMQSGNIVMDLRRIRSGDIEALKILEKCFLSTRRVRNLYIITRLGDLRVYKK